MLRLIAPTTRLHRSWLESRDEFGRGVHQDGTGTGVAGDLDSPDGFAEWVRLLNSFEDPATELSPNLVHCTFRWIVEDDRYVGGIALRHEVNDWLIQTGGHIGYSVRPSARRRGVASWALGETLELAHQRGLDRVLITCHVTNEASRRTIEKAGGVFEDIRGTGEDEVRRYWISR